MFLRKHCCYGLLLALFSLLSHSALSQTHSVLVADLLDDIHAAAVTGDTDAVLQLSHEQWVWLDLSSGDRAHGDKAIAPLIAALGPSAVVRPHSRQVTVENEAGVAWFDEEYILSDAVSYRGAGTAVMTEGGWRLAQYTYVRILAESSELVSDLEQGNPTATDAPPPPASGSDAETTEPRKRCPKRHKTNRKSDC